MAKKRKSKPAARQQDAGPPRRFARTPESILVALGFPTKRENFANLKYWRTFEDFPKRQRNGFDVEKLVEFLEAHKEEFAQRAARAKFIMAQAVPKTNSAGLQGADHGGQSGDDDDEPLAKNQTAIANWLAHHFQSPVSKMDVSDWLRGERLDSGAPNFPVPDAAGRFNKLKCSEWFKKYKYREPSSTLTPDLFRQVEIESKKSELERLDHERYLRGVERGQWIEKAEHNRILSALGRIGRDNLWMLFDSRAYDEFSNVLRAANMPEEWRQLATDALRKLNPDLLLKHHTHLEAVIQENEAPLPVREEAKKQ